MRTLSDLIDKKHALDKFNERIEKFKYERRMRKIKTMITNQFNKAKYTVGKRLTMRKQHESMYYFNFEVGSCDYRTLYIHNGDLDEKYNIDSKFEVVLQNAEYRFTTEEIALIEKSIYLKDLNRMLIDWCRVITDKIIKEQIC